MKKALALCAGIILWSMAVTAQAAPLYYTFEGNISSILNDEAGIIAEAELVQGDAVSYTFLVDFDAVGTITRNDGTVETYGDPDVFYTDYLFGSALQQKDGGVYNAPTDAAEYNLGHNNNDGSPTQGYIFGNSSDDTLQLSSTTLFSEWVLGSDIDVYNFAFDSNWAHSSLYADLTLTEISDIAPVPEPTSLFLLGSGLLGIAGMKKRKS